MGEMRNVYKISIRKLEVVASHGIPSHRWGGDGINFFIKEKGSETLD
jgi:hypothetical protein